MCGFRAAHSPRSSQWRSLVGSVALPGGRREVGDADLVETARRELNEEVGLPLDATSWSAEAVHLAGRDQGPGVPVAPFHSMLQERPVLNPMASEVAFCHWLPLTDFSDLRRHRLGPIPGGGALNWPYFPLLDQPLWGFTYRVLAARYAGMHG